MVTVKEELESFMADFLNDVEAPSVEARLRMCFLAGAMGVLSALARSLPADLMVPTEVVLQVQRLSQEAIEIAKAQGIEA